MPEFIPHLYRPFGKTGLELFVLGRGTIAYGRRWPMDNAAYVEPTDDELTHDLEYTFTHMASRQGWVLLDTAAAYGASEERIGEFRGQDTAMLLDNPAG